MKVEDIILKNKMIPENLNEQLESNKNDINNLKEQMTEVFQNVSNGKELIASAITDKGIPTSSDDTFEVLSQKIIQIQTGFTLPILEPEYEINIGNVNAICYNQHGLFNKFKLDEGEWQSDSKFNNLNPVNTYTFYGQTESGYVNSITTNTPKANQDIPDVPVSSDVTTNSITITTANGCKIKYNDDLYTSPYTFSDLTPETEYIFYSVKEATDTLNESISEALSVYTRSDIPGPSMPIQGDLTNGYYGTVNNIITGSELRSLTACTYGTLSVSDDITWLKFACNGKILFVANRAISTGISWDNINRAGCISGKTVTIGKIQYKCRLFTGSEWSATIVKFTPDNSISNWSGVYTWCQDIQSSTSNRYMTGYYSVDQGTYGSPSRTDASRIWRPVLEFVQIIE